MGTDSFTLTIGGNDPATASADKAGILLLLSSSSDTTMDSVLQLPPPNLTSFFLFLVLC